MTPLLSLVAWIVVINVRASQGAAIDLRIAENQPNEDIQNTGVILDAPRGPLDARKIDEAFERLKAEAEKSDEFLGDVSTAFGEDAKEDENSFKDDESFLHSEDLQDEKQDESANEKLDFSTFYANKDLIQQNENPDVLKLPAVVEPSEFVPDLSAAIEDPEFKSLDVADKIDSVLKSNKNKDVVLTPNIVDQPSIIENKDYMTTTEPEIEKSSVAKIKTDNISSLPVASVNDPSKVNAESKSNISASSMLDPIKSDVSTDDVSLLDKELVSPILKETVTTEAPKTSVGQDISLKPTTSAPLPISYIKESVDDDLFEFSVEPQASSRRIDEQFDVPESNVVAIKDTDKTDEISSVSKYDLSIKIAEPPMTIFDPSVTVGLMAKEPPLSSEFPVTKPNMPNKITSPSGTVRFSPMVDKMITTTTETAMPIKKTETPYPTKLPQSYFVEVDQADVEVTKSENDPLVPANVAEVPMNDSKAILLAMNSFPKSEAVEVNLKSENKTEMPSNVDSAKVEIVLAKTANVDPIKSTISTSTVGTTTESFKVSPESPKEKVPLSMKFAYSAALDKLPSVSSVASDLQNEDDSQITSSPDSPTKLVVSSTPAEQLTTGKSTAEISTSQASVVTSPTISALSLNSDAPKPEIVQAALYAENISPKLAQGEAMQRQTDFGFQLCLFQSLCFETEEENATTSVPEIDIESTSAISVSSTPSTVVSISTSTTEKSTFFEGPCSKAQGAKVERGLQNFQARLPELWEFQRRRFLRAAVIGGLPQMQVQKVNSSCNLTSGVTTWDVQFKSQVDGICNLGITGLPRMYLRFTGPMIVLASLSSGMDDDVVPKVDNVSVESTNISEIHYQSVLGFEQPFVERASKYLLQRALKEEVIGPIKRALAAEFEFPSKPADKNKVLSLDDKPEKPTNLSDNQLKTM